MIPPARHRDAVGPHDRASGFRQRGAHRARPGAPSRKELSRRRSGHGRRAGNLATVGTVAARRAGGGGRGTVPHVRRPGHGARRGHPRDHGPRPRPLGGRRSSDRRQVGRCGRSAGERCLVRLLPHRAVPALHHLRPRRRGGDRPAGGDQPRGHRDRPVGPPAAGPGRAAVRLPRRGARGRPGGLGERRPGPVRHRRRGQPDRRGPRSRELPVRRGARAGPSRRRARPRGRPPPQRPPGRRRPCRPAVGRVRRRADPAGDARPGALPGQHDRPGRLPDARAATRRGAARRPGGSHGRGWSHPSGPPSATRRGAAPVG